jgi:hypothetical protein
MARADALFKHPIRCPTLVLGSERGAMLPHVDIRDDASAASWAGPSVQTRFWADSGRIRLYRDLAEYRDIVRVFAEANLLHKHTRK